MTDNPFDQFDSAPRGIRNNNPLNLTGSKWQGQTGDDGRFAQFDTPEAGRAAADANLVAYHQKHGLNTVSGIVNRWAPPSENDTGAYASTVAKKVGVDPNQPLDMTDPSVRYKLLDAMQEQETGQKAVNPFDQFEADAPPPEVTAYVEGRPDLGVGVAHAPQARPAAPPKPRGTLPQLAQRQDPTIAQDAWSGFVQPFKDAGRTIADEYRRSVNKRAPTSLSELGQGVVADLTGAPKMLWQAATALPAGITMAGVRPAARALNRALPAPSVQDKSVLGLKYGPYRKLTDPNERQAFFENSLNTALSAARPAPGRLPATPKVPGQAKINVKSVDELEGLKTALQGQKTAAYDAVTKAGVKYSPQGFADMAADITKDVTTGPSKINPIRHEKAASMLADIQDLAKKGYSPTLNELDELRQVVRRDLIASDPRGADAHWGQKIIAGIDRFTETAQGPQVVAGDPVQGKALLDAARAAQGRYKKTEAFADTLISAGDRAGSTYSGHNMNNATRQNFRKFINPESSKQIGNLSKAEVAQARRVVRGSPWSNGLREAAQAVDPRTLRGMILHGAAGVASHGLTVPLTIAGYGLKDAAETATMKDVTKLLKMLSSPTKGAKIPPAAIPQLAHLPVMGPTSGSGMVNLLSPKGAVGVSSIAQLPARIPSRPAEKTASSKAKSARR